MFTQSQSAKILSKNVPNFPQQLLVLGTGWNELLTDANIETEIDYQQLFGVKATVPGHQGKLVIATLNQTRVAAMVGRLHMYEGFSAHQATLPIRVFAEAGVSQLLVTAASGALNPKYKVGDFVILNDLLTLFLAIDSPLRGPQFLDTSQLFDVKMRQILITIAAKTHLSFQQGCYAYYHGPNFETPTDKIALRTLGADVVGMSTVPEVLQARWLGIKVAAVALVTNLAFVKHDHKEVLMESEKAADKMVKLLGKYVKSSAELK
ncbi:MAG TPA: purine-nucleoside phosphorylase [Candidatus Woesebacteria bacterium]|nr:purine-nucleoside phosphorylase [Candidatus Woesebacteria bacterium]